VVLIEPDAVLQATLRQWLDRLTLNHCVGSFRSVRGALGSAELRQADLCLFNEHLPDPSELEFIKKLRLRSTSLPAFSYGIYEQSDAIFASMSGVGEGYYLRRRPPNEMLDPVQAAWQAGARSERELHDGITRYFQDLFDIRVTAPGTPDNSGLTSREQEVLNCLRRGYPDKQIAEALTIKPSTVHSHLKKIFEKLSVHTRTEAVMKYLQK
jgi:DNA-binding NarL/FixJ family response regulator